MSKSSSSQASSTHNTTTNNVLDGGAIKASFDFADGVMDEAFDNNNEALKTSAQIAKDSLDAAGDAFGGAERVMLSAMDVNKSVTHDAIDTVSDLSETALIGMRDQNNKSLDMLSGIQGAQATQNSDLLKGIQSSINSANSGGATDLLEMQKVGFIVAGAVLVVMLIIMARK